MSLNEAVFNQKSKCPLKTLEILWSCTYTMRPGGPTAISHPGAPEQLHPFMVESKVYLSAPLSSVLRCTLLTVNCPVLSNPQYLFDRLLLVTL